MSTVSNSDNAKTGLPDTALPGAVLFVCGMNAIRSPMAEFLAKDLLGQKVFCQSAGVEAGEADGFAIAVMAERGIVCDKHIPRTLDELQDDNFDLIITLSPEAHHRALELTRASSVEVEYWPTMDPSAVAGSRDQILDAYRQVRDGLEAKIKARFME